MHRESSRPQAELSGEHGRGKPTVHVSQPEGSIPADGLVPAPGRSTGLTLRGAPRGFYRGDYSLPLGGRSLHVTPFHALVFCEIHMEVRNEGWEENTPKRYLGLTNNVNIFFILFLFSPNSFSPA